MCYKFNRIIIGILISLFFSNGIFGQSKSEKSEIIYSEVEQKAYYPDFNIFLIKNIRYPSIAIEKGLQGQCKIEFIVHANGRLSDFIVLEEIKNCPECSDEAIRILKKSKQWKPAKVGGSNVSSKYISIINFKLE
jgi:protein TonB